MNRRTMFRTGLLGALAAVSAVAFEVDTTDQLGIWPSGNVNYQIRLGGTSSGTLQDGNTSWTAVALSAMAEWNRQLANIQFTGSEAAVGGANENDDANDLFFDDTAYGQSFGGSTLAVTLTRYRGFSDPLPRVESDIVFNNKAELNWDSYRGDLQNNADDFRRVLIHELGHALGLNHPDDAGQNVVAIMNAFVSDLDTVETDDILGGQSLYGVGEAGQPDGGSGTVSGDAFEDDDTAATASVITNGVVQTHSIHAVGDKDWVKFTVGGTGANGVSIETAGSSGDTEIFLFGPNDSSIAIADNDDKDRAGGNFFSQITQESLAPGTYFVRVEEFSNNSVISNYTLTVSWTELAASSGGKLSNLSVRTLTRGAADPVILGFSTNSADKQILVRAIGPTLVPFGVADAIGDPQMEMFRLESTGAVFIDENNNWEDESNSATVVSTGATLGAFATGSDREAILLRSFTPSPYTVQVTDVNGASGQVLIEAYDADPLSATGRLANLSARTKIDEDAELVIAGFVVAGEGNITLLIRGVGPTLANFGVTGELSDPRLRVFNADKAQVATNDDWNSENSATKRAAASSVGAFALDEGSLDAALLITLPPGTYTVQMDGFNNAEGIGLIEIYEVP